MKLFQIFQLLSITSAITLTIAHASYDSSTLTLHGKLVEKNEKNFVMSVGGRRFRFDRSRLASRNVEIGDEVEVKLDRTNNRKN